MAARKEVKPVSEEEVVVQEEVAAPAPKKPERRTRTTKFDEYDLIPCASITVGGLYMVGTRSKDLYEWTGFGDVIDVEYRDLIAAVRSRDPMVFKPRFIIQDDDFLKENPAIEDVYSGMYTPEDIMHILAMPAPQMKATILKLPGGAREALKRTAVTRINDGELDSIQRIKVLDEIFGTNMLLSLTS